MAILDRSDGKLVIRVVYDGPALAGKTTNLKKLCEFFTTRRRSELFSSESALGRTLYLDWLKLEGGVVAGRQMSCHLITVPGQAVLARRRDHILSQADVVVFVADSSPERIGESELLAQQLRQVRYAEGELPPMVLQANKQDAPGALTPEEVRRRVGWDAACPVVGARAADGVGVRETVVLAIRAAADRVQQRVLVTGLDELEGVAPTGSELVEEIRALELAQPSSPVDAALRRHEAATQLAVSLSSPETEAVDPTVDPDEVKASEPAPEIPTVRPSKPSSLPPAAASAPALAPPLPSPQVTAGLVWPAATGRDVLRRVPITEALRRDDLVGRYGIADGSGRSDAYIYEAGIWCLKTSARRRFASAEDARQALLQLARRKLLLGELMVKNTVLSVERDGEGGLWLWTVTPWLTTLRTAMTYATERKNETFLGAELASFAEICVESMLLACRQRLALDVHPSNFARLGPRTYYLDDDIVVDSRVPAIGYALLRRVDEYADYPGALETYIRTLERLLPERLARQDAEALGLVQCLEDTMVRSSLASDAKARLLRAAQACR